MRRLKFIFILSFAVTCFSFVRADEPVIMGVEPRQPIASPVRQWIAIIGENFVFDSTITVTLYYDEETKFSVPDGPRMDVSPNRIEVLVGLTDPGIWRIQVTSPKNHNSNVFLFMVHTINPLRSEINAKIESLARDYNIFPMIIKAMAWKESYWQQYDPKTCDCDIEGLYDLETCEVKDRDEGDGRHGYGIMQVTVNPKKGDSDYVKNLGESWVNYVENLRESWEFNLEAGVRVLLEKWYQSIGFDNVFVYYDTEKPILENWYYAIAWYNGDSPDGYNYAKEVYKHIDAPPELISDYCTPVKITSPHEITGFEDGKSYTIEDICNAERPIHWWDEKYDYIRTIECSPLSGIDKDGVYEDKDRGFVVARSDKSEDATWVMFKAKKRHFKDKEVYAMKIGRREVLRNKTKTIYPLPKYESYNYANSFAIHKKGWLSVHPDVSELATWKQNSILINDEGQPAISSGVGILEKPEITDDYVYAKGEASDAYNTEGGKILEGFTRNFLYLKPDYVIIYDRITTVGANDSKKWILHFLSEPEISGNLTTCYNQKLFCYTLPVQEFRIKKVDEEDESGYDSWRIQVQPVARQKTDVFLHVLSTSEITADVIYGDSVIGAQIANETAKWVVLFGNTEETVDLTEYTISGDGDVENLLCGMSPNSVYNIHQDGRPVFSDAISSGNGILTFDLTLTGTHQISVGGEILGQPGKPVHVD